MKVLQIGLGRRGRNVLRNLVRLYLEGLIDEIFVYDIVLDLIKRAQESYRIVKPGDVSGDYDAVFIVTPPGTHYKFAKEFLSRGIPAFIEKPPVLSPEELEELVRLGKASTDFLLRYTPIARRIKEEGLKPKYIDVSRTSVPSLSVDVSVIRDVMIHDIDLMIYALGKREVLGAHKIYDLEGFPSPAAAEALLEGASVKAFRTTNNVKVRERKIYTDGSVYVIDRVNNYIRVIGEDEEDVIKPRGEEPLYLSVKDFVLYVKENKRPENELSTALETIRACKKIEEMSRA